MNTLKILLFDEDKLTQTIVESYLKELTFECPLEKYNEFNPAVINDFDCFKVIIVNINSLNTDLIEKINVLSKNKQNKFVIISSIDSTDLQVRALRAGCADFLIKPIVKPDFIYSIQTLYNRNFRPFNPSPDCRIFTAVSFEEQTGKTFFLTNLAEALSLHEKTLLIDCNAESNTSLYIKNSLLNSSDFQINIKQYKKSNLFLYYNANFSDIDFKELKKYFSYILIDYNKIMNNEMLFKKYTDRNFILITPENTNISENKKMLGHISSLNINTDLIINRYNNKYISFVENFQNIAGQEAVLNIPRSVIALKQSETERKPIVELNNLSDVSKCFIKLAQDILNGK